MLMPAGSWRRLARRIASSGPVLPILRSLTRSPALPWRLRFSLHRRLGKRVCFPDGASFVVKPPLGPAVRFAHGSTADYLWWLGAYEAATTDLFCRLAVDSPVTLDVGARDGIYSLFAAAANPDAQVYAFEAEPSAASSIRRNLSLNATLVGDRVHVLEVALGSNNGQSEFYVAGGNSSLNPVFRPGSATIQVQVRRGDAVLEEVKPCSRVGLVKIDTESTEPDVLDGLAETIQRDQPLIVCEVLPGRTEDRLNAFAKGQGYVAWSIAPHGLEQLARVTGDTTYRQPNLLFTPSEWSPPAGISARKRASAGHGRATR